MSRLFVVLLVVACGGNGHNLAMPGFDDAHGGNGDGDGSGSATADADPACSNPGSVPALKAQLIIGSGLAQVVDLAQPAGSTDLYVVERAGRIRIIRGGALVATPFLDVTAEINIPSSSGEGGLLGLVFAADYASSGRFFTFSTVRASGMKPNRAVVREYHRSANPDVATPTPVADLIDWPQDGYNNIGGSIAFGPDHYLWIAAGDAAAQPSQAPDVTSRRGKILRVDPDNPGVPPPNNLGGTADPFVWDYGLRNPWRMTFDRKTGDLYISDPGDTLFEEVNIEAPNLGHRDYGWDRMEGMHCVNGASSCGSPGTLPVYERPHETGYSVIIGGIVYRGSALPCLRGRYIFGIHGTGHVLSWVWNGAVTNEVELTDMLAANLINVVNFSEDQAGEVYITTLGGEVYEIVPM